MTLAPIALVQRWAHGPANTFGRLSVCQADQDIGEWHTVELPWRDNARDVSCIPLGVYPMHLATHKGLYPCYELERVPDRTAVQLHAANLASELEGCIAIGSRLGTYRGEWAVMESRAALSEFLDAMRHAPRAWLVVTNAAPGGTL